MIKLLTVIIVILQLLFARFSFWSLMDFQFLISAAVMFTLILKYGKFTETDDTYRLLSKMLPVNVFPLVFLVQSIEPYIGPSTTGHARHFPEIIADVRLES